MTPEITLGNLLTMAAVFISLLALLFSFWRAHRENRKTAQDRETREAARMAVMEQKLDTLYTWWEKTWAPLPRTEHGGD